MIWITDRDPYEEELIVVFERHNYKVLAGRFLVWNGLYVFIDEFTMPQKSDGSYYIGYWKTGEERKIKAWMHLPEPPKETE